MLGFMRRKGRAKYSPVVFHPQKDNDWNLQLLIPRYQQMTADRASEHLLVSLRGKSELKSNTIAGIRRRFLLSKGIDFASHSIRGATAVSLWRCGVPLEVISTLGDWRDFKSFMKFYFRVLASENVVDALFRADGSNLEDDHSISIDRHDSPSLPSDRHRRPPRERHLGSLGRLRPETE